MPSESQVTITWLGHATTRIDTADGKTILIDAWLENNPATPEHLKAIDKVDLLLITHGHFDHTGDAVSIIEKTHPDVIAMVEVCSWLTSKGVENCSGMNLGGTQTWQGIQITAVQAVHSSTIQDGDTLLPAGLACGYVLRFENGFTLYHAGDTDVFSGMELIGRLYRPDVALLPIGSHFTMGPLEAAEAIRLLDVKHVIPIHYGTFPVLTGTPDALVERTRNIARLKIHALKPGEAIRQGELP